MKILKTLRSVFIQKREMGNTLLLCLDRNISMKLTMILKMGNIKK